MAIAVVPSLPQTPVIYKVNTGEVVYVPVNWVQRTYHRGITDGRVIVDGILAAN